MDRFFKIIEISEDEFFQATGQCLDCSQIVIPITGETLVAVDECDMDEICLGLDSLDAAKKV